MLPELELAVELLGVPIPVASACLSTVTYHLESLTLEVEFRESAATYAYSGVAPHVFLALLAAASKGRYFDDNIRNAYPASRVS
jgi:hypothetical protein